MCFMRMPLRLFPNGGAAAGGGGGGDDGGDDGGDGDGGDGDGMPSLLSVSAVSCIGAAARFRSGERVLYYFHSGDAEQKHQSCNPIFFLC